MRRRAEGDGCQTNIWLVTEWLTSGHMQSSNHVYGHQKAVDDDWLICKAVWYLYLKHTPEHVPLSLSNLLRLLPCVLSGNIQNHFCLVFYYNFCRAVQIMALKACLLSQKYIHYSIFFLRCDSYRNQELDDHFQTGINVMEIKVVGMWGRLLLRGPGKRDKEKNSK